jgi:hypothetical protein
MICCKNGLLCNFSFSNQSNDYSKMFEVSLLVRFWPKPELLGEIFWQTPSLCWVVTAIYPRLAIGGFLEK